MTHWANRTDANMPVSFQEGNQGIAQIPLYDGWKGYKLDARINEIPLYDGWKGYKLDARINDLQDERNWNNGSFHYGDDDGTYNRAENDTNDIANSFQIWTFREYDPDGLNDMSGNYMDASAPVSNSHDSLELRMDGERHNDTGSPNWYRYRYDQNDRCWWETTFHVPRGKLIDCILKFQVNPIHLISFNSWELIVSINSINVFSIGILNLKQMGQGTWHNFSIPMGIWTNTSNVFTSTYLNDSDVTIAFTLIYSATSASYGHEDGENRDYQQILIDNAELIFKAEALPSNLGLTLNNTAIQDNGWGKGRISINGDWSGGNDDLLDATFKASDVGLLGSYSVYLKTTLNLHTIKDTPETNYETNAASLGVNFKVQKNGLTNWYCYGSVEVPTRFEETLIHLRFSPDINITAVFEPQNPQTNILSQCDNSTPGLLIIPVNQISATPDGFWKFKAISPNYCESLSIFNNITGSWTLSNEFYSGQYINITAKIKSSTLTQGYIQNTKVKLSIRFPNGTIWSEKDQIASCDSNGIVRFTPFKIPNQPPFYIEGLYQAIIIWNNSYSSYGMNMTGVIHDTFKVIHYSTLVPEKKYYPDNFKDSVINLKVSFYDVITQKAIEKANVYVYDFKNPLKRYNFSEISPGFYLLEFNISGANYGNNSLTIYANSTYFENKLTTVVIELINRTILTVNDDFFENVQFNTNFTVQLKYFDNETGLGIDSAELSTDWNGDYNFIKISPGIYNLTCNASDPYIAGNLYSFNVHVNAYKYESQSITIRVFITELDSQISLKINGTEIKPNDVYVVEVWQKLNLTVYYKDAFGTFLNNATVKVISNEYSKFLIENPTSKHYTILLDAGTFGQGIDNFLIYANKSNYKPNSLPFIIEIIERQTFYEIYINGINKTSDPTIDRYVNSMINLTIKYYDIVGNHISNALISLSGDYSANLTENLALKQYSILINSSQLNIGVRLIKFTAYRPNYELQSDVIRIQVKRIEGLIEVTSGSQAITSLPGKSVTIKLTLKDSISNKTITGAMVNYSWIFGKGTLTEPGNNGTYFLTLNNLVDGSYTIIITAYYNDNYSFESFEITLTVTRPSEEQQIFIIVLIISVIGAALIGTYLFLYLYIFKYPKPVRHIRKYRRTLKRAKGPRMEISEREKTIREAYRERIGKSFKILKSKAISSTGVPDKFKEKIAQTDQEAIADSATSEQENSKPETNKNEGGMEEK
ncbi:MAG: hypothetical protein ACTSO4_03100 [Promethearchaeota archaeon]